MKKHFLQKVAVGFTTCLLGALGVQTAHAQNATVSGNQLIGNQTAPWGTFFVTPGNGSDNSSVFRIYGPNNPSHGTMDYVSGWNTSNSFNMSHAFYLRPNNNNDLVLGLGIHQNGQVQIGATTPNYTQGDYRLSVNGKVVCQSIYVTAPGTWADFVFEPSYEPMALPTLERYLKKNKHLPYIPSAKEVEAKGYNVAEMDAKLLQTVEELTLQVIALSKQVAELKASTQANSK